MTTTHLFIPDGAAEPFELSALFGVRCSLHRSDLYTGGSQAWRDGAQRATTYRDDLRRGWFVVPAGVRYVAVKGVVAGQRCASFCDATVEEIAAAATDLNVGKGHGWSWHYLADDHPDWSLILDLHDLADHRPSKAPASPLYAMKPAHEMVKGEPWFYWSNSDYVKPAEIDGRSNVWPPIFRTDAYMYFAVDLNDSWHRTRSSAPTPPPPVTPEPVGPTRPSHERICAAWEAALHKAEEDIMWAMRHRADGDTDSEAMAMTHVPQSLDVDGMEIPRDEYIDIRSVVLASRVAASKERESRIVLGPIDDPEEA